MVYAYAKSEDRLQAFDAVFGSINAHVGDVVFITEPAGSFHELDFVLDALHGRDALCVLSLKAMGPSARDVVQRLGRILSKHVVLVVEDMPATQGTGAVQPINEAVMGAVLQGMEMALPDGTDRIGVVARPGRPRLELPDGWDEMYDRWAVGEVSSKEFLEWSGFKKATFYNRLSDYMAMRRENEAYLGRAGTA